MLSLAALASSSSVAGSVTPGYQIGTWPGFRSAAITYAFDGPWASQFSIAVPMFNAAGRKMTLFTVTQGGLFLGWAPLQSAAANGHEIGSLTLDHTDLTTLTPAQQTNELANSKTAIEANIPGQKCISLAYPYCNVANLLAVGTYYSAARTCSGQIMPSTPADMLQISSFVCGSASGIQTVQDFVNKANSALAQRGWCVYLVHSIDGADGGYSPVSHTVLQGTLDFFNTNRNQFWVGTFGQVARYIKERNDTSVAETSSGENLITVQVTGTLDSTIFNYPITIRRPLPAAWSGATATQNNNDLEAKIVTVNSTNFIMFDAVPNDGEVTLTRFPSRLFVPSTATESDGTLVGQVVLDTALTNDTVFSLSSSDTSEVTVPATVTLAAAQSNAVFDLTIIDDALLDGDQVVTITASAADYTDAQASITVRDNDGVLMVTLPSSASEGDGTLSGAGRVSVTTPVAADIVVNLTSANPAKLTVPATTVIPFGQTSAVFDITIVDNSRIDGPQLVWVTARASDWTAGGASMTVLDNEAPPDHFGWSVISSPQIVGSPFRVTVTAQDAENNTLDFWLPASISARVPPANSVPVSPVLSGNFTNGVWSGDVAVLQPATNVILLASMGGSFGQSGPFDVVGMPALNIARAGSSVVLSWSAAVTGLTLEKTHALSNPLNWTAALELPAVVGDRYYVTNSSLATNTYYRLKR